MGSLIPLFWTSPQRCARFPEFLQNFSESQILWSLCLVAFLAFTLRLPIQTSLSVAPKLPVTLRSGENCQNVSKTSTPLGLNCNLGFECTEVKPSLSIAVICVQGCGVL